MLLRSGRVLAILFTLPTLLGLSLTTSPSFAGDGCNLYAAPNGSDSAAGTIAAPFRTAQKLSDEVGPGQTGCLRAGTYNEDWRINQGGRPGAPLTLQSYPGERATVVGRLYVPQGSDQVTFQHLNLDGVNTDTLPSPTVNAADTVFDDLDVTNDHTEICFNLGSQGSWGRATRTIIQNSRIHDCGKLPAQNHDHGIYIVASDGAIIRNNVIYDNADRGIQFYPDAQGTTVTGNIIDGNGENVIFSGAGGATSNGNVVTGNIITNSQVRWNVESYWPDGTGTGNVLRGNCVFGGVHASTNGGVQSPDGFTASDNLVADPQFVDRAAKDFRLAAGSPCAGVLTGQVPGVAPVTGPAPAPAPPPTGTPKKKKARSTTATKTATARAKARSRVKAKARAKARARQRAREARASRRTRG